MLAPGDFEVYHIPVATWAVFDCTPETQQDIAIRIWTEWFPSTGYEVELKPSIGAYFPDTNREYRLTSRFQLDAA